jgi:2-keto-3-deoxy-L-rhamnonate aldolase RhmA
MELTFSKIHKYGKIPGSFANSTEQAQRLRDMGVNFLTVETDGTLLRNAFEKLKETININNI